MYLLKYGQNCPITYLNLPVLLIKNSVDTESPG